MERLFREDGEDRRANVAAAGPLPSPGSAPVRDVLPHPAAPAKRPRISSGIQPFGIVHLGNDRGAIRNYVMLQYEY